MKGIYFSFTCYLSITNHSHTLCVVDFCSIICSILETLNSCLNTSCIQVIFLKSDFWFQKITTWPFIEKKPQVFWNNCLNSCQSCGTQNYWYHDCSRTNAWVLWFCLCPCWVWLMPARSDTGCRGKVLVIVCLRSKLHVLEDLYL